MGAMQRRKGAAAERELACILSDETGVTVRRILGQARDSGNDIDLDEFAIEAKRQERPNLSACWGQVLNAADKKGLIPVLAVRQSRQPWFFYLPCDWYMGPQEWRQRTLDHTVRMTIAGFGFAYREIANRCEKAAADNGGT
jgi:Holliday junction resolvase